MRATLLTRHRRPLPRPRPIAVIEGERLAAQVRSVLTLSQRMEALDKGGSLSVRLANLATSADKAAEDVAANNLDSEALTIRAIARLTAEIAYQLKQQGM
jgi:hypothetical protein